MNEGEITISRLRIPVFIGVPDEERQASQDIEISLSIVPETTLFGTNDKIDKTVDYYEISQRLTTVAQSHPRIKNGNGRVSRKSSHYYYL